MRTERSCLVAIYHYEVRFDGAVENCHQNQLFQFEGKLYEQVDGVAMGSPMGPPMANTFMCKIEKQLERENKLAMFYKRFVEDSLNVLPDPVAASEFMATLNKLESSTVDFTMDLEEAASFPLSEWMLSGMVAALTQRCTENRRTEGFCYTTTVTLTPDTNGHC